MNSLVGYGSDSDNDNDSGDDATQVKPRTALPVSSKAPSTLTSLLPPPGKAKSTFALPPPSKPSTGIPLPLPKAATTTKTKKPVRFVISKDAGSDDEDGPKAKKPRLDSSDASSKKGAGSSTLLSMLPAPKQKAVVPEVPTPAPRTLGSAAGGNDTGLVIAEEPSIEASGGDDPALSWLPAHLQKPRNRAAPAATTSTSKPSVVIPTIAPTTQPEDDHFGFFSLGSKPKLSTSSSSKPLATSSKPSGITALSAAPSIKEYQPPEPTPFDPYPGYYQLPSGEWRAYDPAYYKPFWESWQAQVQESSEMGGEEMVSVNPMEEMKKEQIAERERTKGVTAPVIAQPAKPNMNVKNVGGRARSRHQLSTLLAEAYQNREQIEEKIAQGRRNQKEAGNKYGF